MKATEWMAKCQEHEREIARLREELGIYEERLRRQVDDNWKLRERIARWGSIPDDRRQQTN